MANTPMQDSDQLANICLQRTTASLFKFEEAQRHEFTRICQNSSILVTGAAGFIAQSTLPHVIDARPAVLYLLDSSENGLAYLARSLATWCSPEELSKVRFILGDITSPILEHALSQMDELHVVLHFAAAKHVRSERDAASALRILDVNVLGTHRLLQILQEQSRRPRIFAVSTDKAVRPTSLMGASKALMESLLWGYPGWATSARFANVMFSSGSITESWITRFGRNQPLSVPSDTYRFLVTPAEAGRICASALAAPSGSLVVPSAESVDLVSLSDLAHTFLAYHGLEPKHISPDDWLSGTPSDWKRIPDHRGYPVIKTPRDTSGEKQVEEFLYEDEVPEPWSADLLLIKAPHLSYPYGLIEDVTQMIQRRRGMITLAEILKLTKQALPEYTPSPTNLSLDHRI